MADFDLAIIGGGINGTGLARDASGRGISVLLVEMNDLGSGTSSASSKMIHGGLRYLEHAAFRLVREALNEREVLLRMAPHVVRHDLTFLMTVRAWINTNYVDFVRNVDNTRENPLLSGFGTALTAPEAAACARREIPPASSPYLSTAARVRAPGDCQQPLLRHAACRRAWPLSL